MISQRKAREVALQILFQQEFSPQSSAQELFAAFVDNFEIDQKTQDYSLLLTEGVMEQTASINEVISSHSENWSFDRIAVIDRILLQIAIFELKFSKETETPPKLCITDIIDLAKKYSSEDSKNFINGILDQIYQQELT